MARGQAGASEKQLGTTNAVASDEQKRANALQDKLVPGYSSLMDTGYLSPEEEHAATTSEMGSAAAPFDTAKFENSNRAAATHNAAGVTEGADKLALEQGRTMGDQASELQKEKMSNQEAGMYGLSNLEQGDQDTMSKMYGLGPGTLEARAGGKSGDSEAQGWTSVLTGQGSRG